MVSCLGYSSRSSDARWRRNRQRQLARKVRASSKVAANNDSANISNKLWLRHLGLEDKTERGDRFWNTKMKISAEKKCVRRVRFAENKPNYGMRDQEWWETHAKFPKARHSRQIWSPARFKGRIFSRSGTSRDFLRIVACFEATAASQLLLSRKLRRFK